MNIADIDVKIIFASTSGNVEFTCQKVAEKLAEHSVRSSMHRAEVTEEDIVIHNSVFILATSTWEHGELNPYFHRLDEAMRAMDLRQKISGFIGLGDKRYEPVLFCAGADRLREGFASAGGKTLTETLKIDREPFEQVTIIHDWTNKFVSELINLNV